MKDHSVSNKACPLWAAVPPSPIQGSPGWLVVAMGPLKANRWLHKPALPGGTLVKECDQLSLRQWDRCEGCPSLGFPMIPMGECDRPQTQ